MFDLDALGLAEPGKDRTLDTLAELAAHRLPVDATAVTFLNLRDNCFAVRRAGPLTGVGFHSTPFDGSPCRLVIALGEPLAISGGSALQDPRFARLGPLGFRSYLGHPILGPAQDPVGVVAALSREVRIWSEEDREVLCGLADLAATRVMLAAAFRTVREMDRQLQDVRRGPRPAHRGDGRLRPV